MDILLSIFKTVSVVFAISAVATGLQAVVYPVGFSRSFGIPISVPMIKDADKSKSTTVSGSNSSSQPADGSNLTATSYYISLMGVRQFATGTILLTFAYQKKWTEIATVLFIIGIVVAGTDGFYLTRSGARNQGKLHAIPGALIALLAGLILFLPNV